MKIPRTLSALLFLPLLVCSGGMAFASPLTNATVERIDATSVVVRWTDRDPVTVYLADAPELSTDRARLIMAKSKVGSLTIPLDTKARHYILLKDEGDGSVTEVAERVIPLEQGSNFRDMGGYRTASGKAVKWGKIFRSGAMPMLTEADYARLSSLHIGSIIDMRSLDERELAPTLLDDRTGALFIANDYAAKTMFSAMPRDANGKYSSDLYAPFATLYVPQYRAIFHRLLADDGAVVFNCSAGQDRTGTAAALILTALGVPRETILQDYHLSTTFRRPEYEMPKLNPADYPGNAMVAYMTAAYSQGGGKPQPLYGADGAAFLQRYFESLEKRWGSVEAYLEKEIGITADKRARLQALYLH